MGGPGAAAAPAPARRLEWARGQMELEYRRELGLLTEAERGALAPGRGGQAARRPPKTPQGPPRGARGGAGERAAVTGGFDMQAVMGDYEKDRQGQLARNRAVLAQMGLLNHATTAEMRAPQPRASAGRRPRRTPASRDPAAGPAGPTSGRCRAWMSGGCGSAGWAARRTACT